MAFEFLSFLKQKHPPPHFTASIFTNEISIKQNPFHFQSYKFQQQIPLHIYCSCPQQYISIYTQSYISSADTYVNEVDSWLGSLIDFQLWKTHKNAYFVQRQRHNRLFPDHLCMTNTPSFVCPLHPFIFCIQ